MLPREISNAGYAREFLIMTTRWLNLKTISITGSQWMDANLDNSSLSVPQAQYSGYHYLPGRYH